MSEFSGLSFIRVYTHVLYTHLIEFKLQETRCDMKKSRENPMKLYYHFTWIEEENSTLKIWLRLLRNVHKIWHSLIVLQQTIAFEVESINTEDTLYF